MSNLLKSQGIKESGSATRVIDSNEIVQEKIHLFELKLQERQRSQQDEIEGENPEAEFQEGISEDTPEVVEPEIDYKALAQEEAEQILAQAREQAKQILQQGTQEAEDLRKQAFSQGQEEGYQQGIQQAMEEQKQQENQYQQRMNALNREYQEKQESMEKDLIDVIAQVFEQVFMIQFGDKKELLVHLVENAILHIESSKEFQIKVNEDNYKSLIDSKEMLQEKVGSGVKLDFILDPLLEKNQCIIETDGGVFDCSLEVQLENLLKDLRTLSL